MILRILIFSLSVVFLCTAANAQFTPLITTGASSSYVDNKAMYISGGFNRPERIVPQTFAIGNICSEREDTNTLDKRIPALIPIRTQQRTFQRYVFYT